MPRVSPLRVRVFSACRLRYRYQYVDRIPSRLRIADTAGSLVHRVLCDFFAKTPRQQRTPERLVRMFEDGWTALSPRYLRMEGVADLRVSSLRQLENFARTHDLEAEPFMVEPYFQVEVAPGVVLFGRVDRIDEAPDGTLHIIDYKTGTQPDEIDAGQLRLYAVMIEQKLERSVSQAAFWYLDDGRTWVLDLTPEVKRQTLTDLLASVREMESVTGFPPTIGPHCSHCPYLHACEARPEIEIRRAREGW